jgi:hypothetical protein
MARDEHRAQVERRQIDARLVPAVLKPDWIPEDLPGVPGAREVLEQCRVEHRAVLEQLAAARAPLDELDERYDAEDDAFERATIAAARALSPLPEDERTPEAARQEARAAHEVRHQAARKVLAEFVDRTVAVFRAYEDEWLSRLRGAALEGARAKEQEAQRLLDEARNETYRVYLWGSWLQKRNNDGVLSQQNLPPVNAVAPLRWTPQPLALKRAWHMLMPWNAGHAAAEAEKRVVPNIERDTQMAARGDAESSHSEAVIP